MKPIVLLMSAAALLLLAGVFLGCSDDEFNMTSDQGPGIVSIASVYPSDGATGITTSTMVALKFTGPVDTMSVMENLFLAGGQPMHEWLDSLNHHGGFGMMNMGMEGHMMTWMDSIQIQGEFHWNGTLDSCEFVPASALMSSTDYLCLLHEGGMYDMHGGLIGGTNHHDDGYHMYEFSTGP